MKLQTICPGCFGEFVSPGYRLGERCLARERERVRRAYRARQRRLGIRPSRKRCSLCGNRGHFRSNRSYHPSTPHAA